MSKARTKARKLADKRRRQFGICDLDIAPTPKREPNGQHSRRGQARSPDIETLKSRCIQMGKAITPENIKDMRAPWWGCSAGRAIGQAVMEDKTRQDLWTAIQHMRRTVTVYDAAIGAPRRHAVCLRLLAPTDEMATDADAPPLDTRSDADKMRQAVSALMSMETWLGYADKNAASEAKRVVVDDGICVDADGLICALRCVSDGIKGRKMQYRGRDLTSR